ncbi:hypothetical protein BDQ12DRAFT_508429 [Crucibulum laeve]|uniref:Uncharacterized protein n=1 Tax=Crucibulum laeve TaxID=68775 RepID=A0A5C3M520_9AGAR|nr:hypothetical protein BDQ12DRAFT_508429 [Crucibulum laeve]
MGVMNGIGPATSGIPGDPKRDRERERERMREGERERRELEKEREREEREREEIQRKEEERRKRARDKDYQRERRTRKEEVGEREALGYQQQQQQQQQGLPHQLQHQHPLKRPHPQERERDEMMDVDMDYGHPIQHLPPHMQHPEAVGLGLGYGPMPMEYELAEEEEEEEEEVQEAPKARVQVSLGTFVFPKVPFPYLFELGSGIVPALPTVLGDEKAKDGEKTKEGEKDRNVNGIEEGEVRAEEEKKPAVAVVPETEAEKTEQDTAEMVDIETRATIIIPHGHIPLEQPEHPHIWGGGVPGRPKKRVGALSLRRKTSSKPPSSSKSKTETKLKRKRRIYTDDSDLFLCAIHSGWISWQGARKARERGRDLRVDVRILRCVGEGRGSVFIKGVDGVLEQGRDVDMDAPEKKNMRKEEVVARFLGGPGEGCWNVKGRSGAVGPVGDADVDIPVGEDVNMDEDEDEDEDGRSLVSAAWGSGHDGSAIEILGVEFVEKGTSRSAPTLGRRNRSQRLSEYAERRSSVLGTLTNNPICTPITRLAGRKRRRNWDWPPQSRRVPNSVVLDVILEDQEEEEIQAKEDQALQKEKEEMNVRTLVFGIGQAGDMRLGYKYVPSLLKEMLFPSLKPAPSNDSERPRKRRRTNDGTEDVEMQDLDSEDSSKTEDAVDFRPIILETAKESYHLSLTETSSEQPTPVPGEGRKYDIALVLETEFEEEHEPAAAPEEPVVGTNAVVVDQKLSDVVQPASSPKSPPSEDIETKDVEPKTSETKTADAPTPSAEEPVKSSTSSVLAPEPPLASANDSPKVAEAAKPEELVAEAKPETKEESSQKESVDGPPSTDAATASTSEKPIDDPKDSPEPAVTVSIDAKSDAPQAEFSTEKISVELESMTKDDIAVKVQTTVETPIDPSSSALSPSEQPGGTSAAPPILTSEAHDIEVEKPEVPPLTATEVEEEPKHPLVQVLQRNLGQDMFRFTEEGVTIIDGSEGMATEWLIQVKCWKWAPRK